jgi:cytochrome P450
MTLSELPGHQSPDSPVLPEEWSRFDHLATGALGDLASLMTSLSATCPIGHSDLYGGFEVLTRAADVREAARQPELFRSQPNPGPGPGFPYSSTSPIHIPMIGSDPPLHRDFRQPLHKRFSQASAEAMAPHIRAIVTGLIDGFIETGQADFGSQLVIPLPTHVTGELLDLPIDRRLEFQKWSTQIVAGGSGAEGYEELASYVQDLYDLRRANPGDDIPSFVLGFEIEGQPITRIQWVGMVLLLIMAGLDTTTNGGALILHFLGTRPEIRERLAANPEGLGDAVEELLRWVSPVPQHSRGVAERCELGGHQFEKGDVVLLHWFAANRDPEEFPDPDVFIADRRPNRHYAFGAGAHRCLGSHLAKVELRVLLEEVLRRIPDYQVVDGGVTRYPGFNRGMSELQVTFTPGAREGAST